MTSFKKYFAIALLISTISLPTTLWGQTDPPPPPGGHGESGDQPPGGGAPIGSGLLIMLALGGIYGGRKTYQLFHADEK